MEINYKVGRLNISPVEGWLDVTQDLADRKAPFTLAKADGIGALQFSLAEYESGKRPQVTLDDLRTLLADFALSRGLGRPFDMQTHTWPLLRAAQSFDFGTQFLRVWYCSNGSHIALITYVCGKGQESVELADCETTVGRLEFDEG